MNPNSPYGNAPAGGGTNIAAPLTAVLDIGASVYNNAANRKQSKENTKRTIAANKEMAEYQYQKDLEMWKLQNLYNSPEQQMARLKAAGLNPNLVYGSNAPGNQSGPAPGYNAPDINHHNVKAMQLPRMLGTYLDLEMRKAQVDNVRANTRNTEERTVNEKIAQVFNTTKSNVARDTENYQVEAARLTNKKTKAIIEQELQKIALLSKEQQIKYFDTLIRKQQARGSKHEADKKKEESEYMKWKNKLRDHNLTDTDNVLLRQLIRLFSESDMKNAYKFFQNR